MSFSAHRRSTDEKVGLISSQLAALRRRLNSLAIQRAIFSAAAVAVAATALIYASAMVFAPLWFLACASAVTIVAALAGWRLLQTAWRMRASAPQAAALADERAGLKGRLTTIVQTSPERRRGAMWAFLVEDALGRGDAYQPRTIERRRVDRSIAGFLVAIAVALVLVPLASLYHPAPTSALRGPGGEITLNLNDLQIRPAGSGENGLQVEADAATMRRLEDRLAQESTAQGAAAGAGGEVNRLLDHARSFAGRVQRKLRGEVRSHSRLKLKLAAGDPGLNPPRPRDSAPQLPAAPGNHDRTGQFSDRDQRNSDSDSLPPMGKIERGHRYREAPSGNQNLSGMLSTDNSLAESDSSSTQHSGSRPRSGHASNAAPSRGIGADPGGLFGAPMNSNMSSEGFAISIQARPMQQGASGASEAYLPPKVTTPLNPNQMPDEPVARASVPAADRGAIQRVFER